VFGVTAYRAGVLNIHANSWAVSGVAMPYTVTESLCFALDDDNILIAGGENMDIGLPTPKTFIFCISKATLTQRTGGEREGVGRSRRQFLTAAAPAAGMLARCRPWCALPSTQGQSIRTIGPTTPIATVVFGWAKSPAGLGRQLPVDVHRRGFRFYDCS
jgi:hypothetical protein